MSVRKAHNTGRNHLRNVVDYYQQIGHEKAQSVIDSITSSYAAEGQANPMLQPPGMGGMGGGAFNGPPPPFGFPGRPGQVPSPFPMPPGGMGAPNGLGRGMPMPFPGGLPPPGNLPFPFPPPGGFPNAGGAPNGMPPFMPPGQNGMPAFPPFPLPNQMNPMVGGFPPLMGASGPPGAAASAPSGR